MNLIPLLQIGDLACLDCIPELKHYSDDNRVIILIEQVESMEFESAKETISSITDGRC